MAASDKAGADALYPNGKPWYIRAVELIGDACLVVWLVIMCFIVPAGLILQLIWELLT